MQVGDIISISREDFIRLAPKGLVLRRFGTLYYYLPTATTRHYDAVSGYVIGDLDAFRRHSYHDHICGLWSRFSPRRAAEFTVVQLPALSLYRRTMA